MDQKTLERCWAISGDFAEFEDLVSQHGVLALEKDHWREIASFLYEKAQAPPAEGSDDTLPVHARPQYESFCPSRFCESPPARRPKFARGTVEGEMIHAMSPGSTPNRTCSVLSPLESSSSTPPHSGQSEPDRRPLAPVMPVPIQGDVPCLWSNSIVKPSQQSEALPPQHVLNSSWNSSDSNTHKENLPMEAGKLQVRSPLASPPVHFPQEGLLPDASAAYTQSLTRYGSNVLLQASQTLGSTRYCGQPGATMAQAMAKAVDDRTVGYFPRASVNSSVTPPKSPPVMVTAPPARLGTGSTPVPLRNTATSPRHASPLQVLSNRGSRPPPQVQQAQTSPSTMSGVGAVRSASLVPASSGSLRANTFGGAQCSGSLCAAIGGGGGSGHYQCNSQPMVLRQPQDRRTVVSPRF